MSNNNDENHQYDTKYSVEVNKNDNNNDKIIYVNKIDKHNYRQEDDDNKIIPVDTNANLNPFTVAMDMWQSYVKASTDAYRNLFFRNPSMTKGEFWFMYWRSDSN